MEAESIFNQPVVIDNGSGNLKAGFAGEMKPKAYGSAIVGRPKYQKIMAGSLGGAVSDKPGGSGFGDETYIGDLAQEYRGILRLTYPIEHGVVTDWGDMERLWFHTYTHDLKANAEEHPLLITEAPLNPRSNRDKMSQIFFEQFNVPSLYVSIQAVLALYASGRTTGVVVDSGDGVSHVVPVYEGFALPTSIKRMDIAGRDVSENLAFNVRKMTGFTFLSSSEFEIVRTIKEKCCFVSKDPVADEKLYSTSAYNYLLTNKIQRQDESELIASYKLPDGHSILVGVERFRSPEILFNPQLIGAESPGIHELVSLAISKTDLDLRPVLYQNLILSGGNTLLKNFGDRLLSELKRQQHLHIGNSGHWGDAKTNTQEAKTKIKIHAPSERKYTTWIGGSILAGLSTFKKMWVTSQEYQEDPHIVHKKFM